MDTTQTEQLLSDLKSADPADAPEIADALTARLAEALDGAASSGDDQAPPQTDGEPS
ncbi:MAG: hypothetical protein KJO17_10900 [Acidimicrobiia bacterium]|nr:hypothetical protein [Acidimicrobiia bacterium]NNL69092.1 hypothetical protein [Acidimicrobiia bacterium]